MSVDSDCIRIHFDKTKTLQGGEATKHPKYYIREPLAARNLLVFGVGNFSTTQWSAGWKRQNVQ